MSPKWWWFRLGSFFSRSFPFKVQCSFLLVVGCKTLPEKNYAADFSLWACGLSSVLFFLNPSDLGQVGAKWQKNVETNMMLFRWYQTLGGSEVGSNMSIKLTWTSWQNHAGCKRWKPRHYSDDFAHIFNLETFVMLPSLRVCQIAPHFFFHSRLQKWQPTGRDRQHVLFSLCSARAGVLWCFSCTVLAGGLGHLTSSRKFPGRMAREGCCSFFFTTQNFNAWMFETRDTVVWQLLWIRCRFFFSDSTWYSNVQIFSTWFAITEPQQFHLRVFLEGHNH